MPHYLIPDKVAAQHLGDYDSHRDPIDDHLGGYFSKPIDAIRIDLNENQLNLWRDMHGPKKDSISFVRSERGPITLKMLQEGGTNASDVFRSSQRRVTEHTRMITDPTSGKESESPRLTRPESK